MSDHIGGRGIGIGAPGLGKPLPSPGIDSVLIVTTTYCTPGEPDYEVESRHQWPGYSPTDVIDTRLHSLKEARSDVKRTSPTSLTLTTPREGDSSSTEHMLAVASKESSP